MQLIASRLKYLRDREEESQKQVAEALDIKLSTYKSYETARRRIPVDILRNAALHYAVTMDFIIGITDIPYSINKEDEEIMRKYYSLKEENQLRIQERIMTFYETEHPPKTLKDKNK